MIINVKVVPGSREESFEKVSEGEFRVKIKEPAKNGKANARLVKLLAKELGVSYKQIKIKNPGSRKKIVDIRMNSTS